MSLLDVVVVPYFESVVETFLYACDRLQVVFEGKFHRHLSSGDRYNFADHFALLDGIDPVVNRIKIEVVDLGANVNNGDMCCFRVGKARSSRSAHVQPLYIGAQDPEWILQMRDPSYPTRRSGRPVPNVMMGGYVLMPPGNLGQYAADLRCYGHSRCESVVLDSASCDYQVFDNYALPNVWE